MATGNKQPRGKIEFIGYHKPGLGSGEYEVAAKQKVGEAIDADPCAAGATLNKTDSVGNPPEK